MALAVLIFSKGFGQDDERQQSFILGELRYLVAEKRTIHVTWYTSYFFRNETFLFVKIESWNFQQLFDLEFRETSQNFNYFGLLFITYTKRSSECLSEWAEISQGFTKIFFKNILKVSAFYLEKQKSFIPKIRFFNSLSISKQKKPCLPTQFSVKVLVRMMRDRSAYAIKVQKYAVHSLLPKRGTSFSNFSCRFLNPDNFFQFEL